MKVKHIGRRDVHILRLNMSKLRNRGVLLLKQEGAFLGKVHNCQDWKSMPVLSSFHSLGYKLFLPPSTVVEARTLLLALVV